MNATQKNDTAGKDRLDINLVYNEIEKMCEQYLNNTYDLLEFEALPSVINETIAVLSMQSFKEKYEFEQINETCFRIKLRGFNIV